MEDRTSKSRYWLFFPCINKYQSTLLIYFFPYHFGIPPRTSNAKISNIISSLPTPRPVEKTESCPVVLTNRWLPVPMGVTYPSTPSLLFILSLGYIFFSLLSSFPCFVSLMLLIPQQERSDHQKHLGINTTWWPWLIYIYQPPQVTDEPNKISMIIWSRQQVPRTDLPVVNNEPRAEGSGEKAQK